MKKEVLFAATLLPLFPAVGFAVDYNWYGTFSDDYAEGMNWGGTVPGAGDVAIYDNPALSAQTIVVDGDWSLSELRVNVRPSDLSKASIEQTGGVLNISNGVSVTNTSGGDSVYHLVAGTININNGLNIGLGGGAGTFIQDGGIVNLQTGKFGGAWNGTSASMTYVLNDGELNVTSGSNVEFAWDGGTATFNQTGGTASFSGGGAMQIGNGTGGGGEASKGFYNLEGGTLSVSKLVQLGFSYGGSAGEGTFEQTGGIAVFSGKVEAGSRGKGTIKVSSGTATFEGDLILGTSGGRGDFELSSGTVEHTGGWLVMGQGGNSVGTFTQTGGDFSTSATVELGRNGGTVDGVATESVWTVSGATSTTTFNGNVLIGMGGGKGRFIVNDGEVAFNGTLSVGDYGDNPGSGVFELNGGTVTAKQISSHTAAASSSFIFNGGTLKAANDAEFTLITSDVDSVLVNAGGGTIDTNGVDVEIASGFSGVGDLEKTGTGILTLSGDSSAYEGALAVSAGGVVLDGAVWTFLVDGTEDTALNAIIVDGGATLELYDVELRVALTNASGLSVGDTIDVIQGASGLDAAQVSVVSEDGNYAFIFLDSGKLEVTAVPEPSTYALLGAGLLAGLVALRRRKVS